jgi:hypothetical protein
MIKKIVLTTAFALSAFSVMAVDSMAAKAAEHAIKAEIPTKQEGYKGEYDKHKGEYDKMKSNHDEMKGKHDEMKAKHDELKGKHDDMKHKHQ